MKETALLYKKIPRLINRIWVGNSTPRRQTAVPLASGLPSLKGILCSLRSFCSGGEAFIIIAQFDFAPMSKKNSTAAWKPDVYHQENILWMRAEDRYEIHRAARPRGKLSKPKVSRPMALTSNDTISVPLDDPIRLWLYTMASTGTGEEQSRLGPVEL
jgi:hypothetical protein